MLVHRKWGWDCHHELVNMRWRFLKFYPCGDSLCMFIRSITFTKIYRRGKDGRLASCRQNNVRKIHRCYNCTLTCIIVCDMKAVHPKKLLKKNIQKIRHLTFLALNRNKPRLSVGEWLTTAGAKTRHEATDRATLSRLAWKNQEEPVQRKSGSFCLWEFVIIHQWILSRKEVKSSYIRVKGYSTRMFGVHTKKWRKAGFGSRLLHTGMPPPATKWKMIISGLRLKPVTFSFKKLGNHLINFWNWMMWLADVPRLAVHPSAETVNQNCTVRLLKGSTFLQIIRTLPAWLLPGSWQKREDLGKRWSLIIWDKTILLREET